MWKTLNLVKSSLAWSGNFKVYNREFVKKNFSGVSAWISLRAWCVNCDHRNSLTSGDKKLVFRLVLLLIAWSWKSKFCSVKSWLNTQRKCDFLIQDSYLGSSFETRIISKSLPVTGPKCNRPVNVSEKRKLIDTSFSLTTYLLYKYFPFIDDKYNNEWTNECMDLLLQFLVDQQVSKLLFHNEMSSTKVTSRKYFHFSVPISSQLCDAGLPPPSARTLDLIWCSSVSSLILISPQERENWDNR